MLRAVFLLFFSMVSALGGEPLVAIVHPTSPLKALTREKCAQILKGDITFLEGKRVSLVLTKPSSSSLPAVTFGLLSESPQAYMMRIKAAKLRGLALDPQFVDSAEGLLSAVASSPTAIGFLAAKDAKGTGVRILAVTD